MHDRHFANFVRQLLCGAVVIIVLTGGPTLARSAPQPTAPSDFHFVAFGDIKNGLLNCSTDYFLTIRRFFDSFDGPLIYTPGDNDWADRDKVLAGGYDTRKRLGELRRVFFADTLSMGSAPIPVSRQSDGADHPEMTEKAT